MPGLMPGSNDLKNIQGVHIAGASGGPSALVCRSYMLHHQDSGSLCSNEILAIMASSPTFGFEHPCRLNLNPIESLWHLLSLNLFTKTANRERMLTL